MTWLWRLLGLESSADVSRIVDGAWHFVAPLPTPWLVAILVLGGILATINFLPWLAIRTNVRFITFVLRILMVLVLLAAFQKLEWHGQLALREPQSWTVLVDDSASMATRDAGGELSRFDAAKSDADWLVKQLQGRVNVEVATVSGQTLGETAGPGPTPLAAAIQRAALARHKTNRLLLLTDGRDSDDRDLSSLGEDLRLRDTRVSVAIYGSRTTPTDSGLSAEPDRSIIRLGEELVIHGTLYGAVGDVQLALKENGKPIKTSEVSGSQDAKDSSTKQKQRRFELRHRPKEKGQHVYSVELPGNDAAMTNNVARFTVQVVEEKINVLLLEGFPRFEFKLFKSVLEVDPLVNLVSVSQVPGGGVYVQGEPLHKNAEQGLIASQAELFKYDVVILRDVPRQLFRAGGDTSESRLRMLVEFVTKRGGGLMVCGGQDVFRAGGYEDSALAEVLPFDMSNHFSSEAQFEGRFFADIAPTAHDHPLLRLLPDAAENRSRWNNLPKLDGSNNVGRFKPLATPLLTRVANLKTKADITEDRVVPILGSLSVGEGKVLGAAVDTLWRWQLQPDFEDPPLTMLLANAIRYLAPPPGRKPDQPVVSLTDPTPQVGQEIMLTTDLRDANYDPIRNADLAVTVTRPDDSTLRILPRDLPEEPGHYSYRVPIEQPGPYKVLAKFGKFESSREFLAGAAAGEFTDLSADFDRMKAFTKTASGELLQQPLREWLARTNIQPTERLARRELEVWNSPLAMLLFIALVSFDCYVRKRQGLV